MVVWAISLVSNKIECAIEEEVDMEVVKVADENIYPLVIEDGLDNDTPQATESFENVVRNDAKLNVLSLLVIDTHGNEPFKNLRFPDPKLCDIAILVFGIKHGFEPQTIESLNRLRMRNTELIVTLNKSKPHANDKPPPSSASETTKLDKVDDMEAETSDDMEMEKMEA
ncbi:hypothetical protein L1887_01690 [Cichorium endivia]|nr:hypothetical protein L1887_01690 [Cichorium endivia]